MNLFQWLRGACAGGSDFQIPPPAHTPPVRKRYQFFGCVQGVGFRYEAKILAGQLRLTGWVRNEGDGSVTVEVQGEDGCVGLFLQAMQAVPRFDISDIRAEDLPVSETERGFTVRY